MVIFHTIERYIQCQFYSFTLVVIKRNQSQWHHQIAPIFFLKNTQRIAATFLPTSLLGMDGNLHAWMKNVYVGWGL